MAQDPWAQFRVSPAQSAQPQPVEDPIIRPVDPYKQAAESRAQVDQSLQIEAANRAREDQAMQREKFRLDQQKYQAEQQRQAKQDQTGTVEQGKAAGFLLRALKSNDTYEAQKIGPRSYVGQAMAETAPSLLNTLPPAVGNSPERQVADANQDDFIAATLRYESGAAIPPSEMEAQRRRYFPMPGDSQDAIDAKAELRRTAIAALKQSAGQLGEKTFQDYLGSQDGLTGSVTDETGLDGNNLGAGDGNDPNGGGNGGGDGTNIPISQDLRSRALQAEQMASGDQSGLQGLSTLAQQGITLGLSDEAAGVGGFLSSLIQGQDPRAGYVTARDARRSTIDKARQEWGLVGSAAEFAGGGGAARVAGGLNSLLQATKQGAALGGVAGYGYGEGAGGSAANALAGAVTGGVVGAGAQQIGTALANRAARTTPDMEVVQAGQRQGIPIRQPDARPDLRGELAQAETTQTGGPIIRDARAADQAAVEQRIAEVGGSGDPGDPYALGTRVQEAGRRYIATTKQQANRLYDRARQAAGNATVTPRNADAVLDANIQELRNAGENSNAAAIKYLEGLRNDIDRGLTLDAVQNLRTNMRGQISERGLTSTDTDRRVSQVIDAMNQDLAEQLPQEASQALRAADGFYKQRQEFINGTLKQFLGDKNNVLPAETAAQRLVSMAQGKGNYERFSSMWKQLEPSEQADVSATIAASLGRKANGDFSLSTLIRSLDHTKGINPRTARLVFGEDGAKALQDLRVIAAAKTEAMGRQSPSGIAVTNAAGGLKTLLWGALGMAGGGPGGAAAGAVGRNLFAAWGEQRAARMLLNPDFTKWLKNMPEAKNPQAIDRYMGRLATIRTIAANDNKAFTTAIMDAFRASPGTVAASGQQKDETRRVPPKQ